MKPFRENWYLQFAFTSAVYLITGIILDYFTEDYKSTVPYFIGKIIGALIFGFILSVLLSPLNPFKKKKKQ